MKSVKLFSLLSILVFSFAFAEHEEDKDIYVNVDVPVVSDVLEEPAADMGEDLYKAQEEAHETVTETTGAEVDHYYVNVCFGKGCIPIDPFSFGR